MADTVRIQVITEETTPYGTFRDAIYYKDLAEYQAKKADGSHDAEKSARVANYVNAVQNPPAPVEPSKEELEAAKATLQAQIADIDAKLVTAKPKDAKEEVIE